MQCTKDYFLSRVSDRLLRCCIVRELNSRAFAVPHFMSPSLCHPLPSVLGSKSLEWLSGLVSQSAVPAVSLQDSSAGWRALRAIRAVHLWKQMQIVCWLVHGAHWAALCFSTDRHGLGHSRLPTPHSPAQASPPPGRQLFCFCGPLSPWPLYLCQLGWPD